MLLRPPSLLGASSARNLRREAHRSGVRAGYNGSGTAGVDAANESFIEQAISIHESNSHPETSPQADRELASPFGGVALPTTNFPQQAAAIAGIDLVPFSSFAGGGLELASPIGLAVVAAFFFAARDSREAASRGFGEAALSRIASLQEDLLATAKRERAQAEMAAAQAEAALLTPDERRQLAKQRAEEATRAATQQAARAAAQAKQASDERLRIQAQHAAEAAAREEQRLRLEAEASLRQAQERAIIEAAERKAREDAAQRAAEVAAQQAAEEAARAAEVAAAAAAREEDRQRRGVKTFTTRFKGSAFGAPQALHADAWPNTRDAAAGVTRLCRAAAAGAVAGFESDVQQRSMSGQGPLACMDGMELTAWLRLMTLRLEQVASAALWRGLLEAEVRARQSPNNTTLNIPFTLEAARDVIPVGDASSVRGRMESAARALLSEEEENSSTARQLVRAVAAEEAAAIQGAGTLKREQAALLGLIITQTHLLERCQTLDGQDPALRKQACLRMASEEARLALSGLSAAEHASWTSLFLDVSSGDDSMPRGLLGRLLGEEHPLVDIWRDAAGLGAKAGANAGEETEEAWPDERTTRQSRLTEQQLQQPVPERVWAMRNAAGTLLMTGAVTSAVELLAKADALNIEWIGSDTHPALLGVMRELHNAVQYMQPERAERDGLLHSTAVRIITVCLELAQNSLAAGDHAAAVRIATAASTLYGPLASTESESACAEFLASLGGEMKGIGNGLDVGDGTRKAVLDAANKVLDELVSLHTVQPRIRTRGF